MRENLYLFGSHFLENIRLSYINDHIKNAYTHLIVFRAAKQYANVWHLNRMDVSPGFFIAKLAVKSEAWGARACGNYMPSTTHHRSSTHCVQVFLRRFDAVAVLSGGYFFFFFFFRIRHKFTEKFLEISKFSSNRIWARGKLTKSNDWPQIAKLPIALAFPSTRTFCIIDVSILSLTQLSYFG